jgi:hypothetical protein
MNTYSPYRSTVTDETLVEFLQADMQYDLETVPGIGPKAKEILQQKHIMNSFQLLAIFLNLKEDEGDDTVAHCTKFYQFLKDAGVKGNRHSIVKSVAEKVAIFLPSLYIENQFQHLEPMESEA